MNNISSLQNLIVEVRLLLQSSLPSLSGIDWINEIRLMVTASLLGSIIVFLHHYLAHNRLAVWVADYVNVTWAANFFNATWVADCFNEPHATPHPQAGPIYARPRNPDDPTRRTVFAGTSVAINGWPSRGGVIVLEDATHVDLIFLGLSTTDPPSNRDRGLASNDTFDHDAAVLAEHVLCQRLLLLGAKWWDSEARYRFVVRVRAGFQPAIDDLESGRVEEPVLRERRWVRVGWEGAASDVRRGDGGTGSGGFWLLDCDTDMYGGEEDENMVPADAGRLGLARSMAERCEILKRLGARFFAGLQEYEGESTYLRAWEWKSKGEVGELVKVQW